MKQVCKKAAMPVLAGLILSGCATTKQEPVDGDRGFNASVNKSKHRVLGSRGIIPLPYDEPQDFEVVMKGGPEESGFEAIGTPDPVVDFPEPEVSASTEIEEPKDFEPPKEVELIKYVVKKGDSLWRVADMYGVSHKNLARINGLPLDKPLQIGVVLEIPEGGKLRKRTPRKSTKKSPSKSSKSSVKSGSMDVKNFRSKAKQPIPADGKYTVKSGDSLWTICNKFGITNNEITTWNSLKNDRLYPGQVLVLKSGLTQPAEVKPAQVEVKPEEVKDVAPVQPVEVKPEAVEQPADVAVDPLATKPEVKVETPAVATPEIFIDDHIVQANETLQDIADLLVVDAEKIKKQNPGVNWNDLKPGQVIKVPIEL